MQVIFRTITVVCGFIFLNATLLFAEKALNGKAPWQWSDDERVAARVGLTQTDASPKIQAVSPGLSQRALEQPVYHYRIDGARHPELFFPHELFDRLTLGLSGDLSTRDAARRSFEPALIKAGYEPRAFWARLNGAAAKYVALKEAHQHSSYRPMHITAANGKTLTIREEPGLCSSRLGALNAARAQFDGTTFDQVLYSAIAPLVKSTWSRETPVSAEELRFVAGGCK